MSVHGLLARALHLIHIERTELLLVFATAVGRGFLNDVTLLHPYICFLNGKMRSFILALSWAVSTNALVARNTQKCCFSLEGHGEVASGSIGQSSDGHNHVGGDFGTAQFCIDSDGGITDGQVRLSSFSRCITLLTPVGTWLLSRRPQRPIPLR